MALYKLNNWANNTLIDCAKRLTKT